MTKQAYIFTEKNKAEAYGIGTYIKQLINCFISRNDISINIIKLRVNCKEFYQEIKKGITYFYVPKTFDLENQDFYYRNVFYLIYPYITSQPNIVFHFNLIEQLELVDYLSKYFTNAKFCITIHFFNWSFLSNGDIKQLKSTIKKLHSNQTLSDIESSIIKSINNDIDHLKKADGIICLSEYAKKCIEEIYNIPIEKTIKINNGIKLSSSLGAKDEIKKNLFISPSDIVITFVGRLYESKGINVLIEAFEILLKKYTPLKLIIVGDGNIIYYINRCFPFLNKVLFTGYISQEQLELIYSITDIGILPSFHEQCSFVAIEMMSHKIPIVYTNTLGLNEMLNHDVNIKLKRDKGGKLFLDSKELAEKLHILCMNKSLRSDLSKICHNTYRTRYTFEEMEKEYTFFYDKLYSL